MDTNLKLFIDANKQALTSMASMMDKKIEKLTKALESTNKTEVITKALSSMGSSLSRALEKAKESKMFNMLKSFVGKKDKQKPNEKNKDDKKQMGLFSSSSTSVLAGVNQTNTLLKQMNFWLVDTLPDLLINKDNNKEPEKTGIFDRMKGFFGSLGETIKGLSSGGILKSLLLGLPLLLLKLPGLLLGGVGKVLISGMGSLLTKVLPSLIVKGVPFLMKGLANVLMPAISFIGKGMLSVLSNPMIMGPAIAGTLGYALGSWLDKQLGISDKIIEFTSWMTDGDFEEATKNANIQALENDRNRAFAKEEGKQANIRKDELVRKQRSGRGLTQDEKIELEGLNDTIAKSNITMKHGSMVDDVMSKKYYSAAIIGDEKTLDEMEVSKDFKLELRNFLDKFIFDYTQAQGTNATEAIYNTYKKRAKESWNNLGCGDNSEEENIALEALKYQKDALDKAYSDALNKIKVGDMASDFVFNLGNKLSTTKPIEIGNNTSKQQIKINTGWLGTTSTAGKANTLTFPSVKGQEMGDPNPAIKLPNGYTERYGLWLANKNINLEGLAPGMLNNLIGMNNELLARGGTPLVITSGFRTKADQMRMIAKYPKYAAALGTSPHEYGVAIDINSKDGKLDFLEKNGIMKKWGFHRPIKTKKDGSVFEPWHVEPLGGGRNNIARAKLGNFSMGTPVNSEGSRVLETTMGINAGIMKKQFQEGGNQQTQQTNVNSSNNYNVGGSGGNGISGGTQMVQPIITTINNQPIQIAPFRLTGKKGVYI